MIRELRSPAWVTFTLLLLFFQLEAIAGRSRKNRTNNRQNTPYSREISTATDGVRGEEYPQDEEVDDTTFNEADDPNDPPTAQTGGGTGDDPDPKPQPPVREGRMPIPAPTFAQTNGHGIVSPFNDLDKEEIPPGLPPALDGFLVLLLQVAHIEAPNYAVLNKQELTLAQKVMVFKSGIALLRRVYGSPEKYPSSAPRIGSIQRYLDLTEPTRGHSGTLSGDFQRLWYFVDKLKSDPDRVPTAYAISLPNKGTGDFESELDNYQAQAYRYEMASHMRRILASTALQASGGTTLSLMESVFKAIGTFLVNTPSNWSSILNSSADFLDDQMKEGEQKKQGPVKLTDRMRQAAGFTDTVKRITESEARFMDLLATLEDQDFDSIAALISSFEDSLNEIVLALKNVGTRIASSEQVRILEGSDEGYISELLKVLFDDYPKLLPGAIFKDIILDLFRTPKRASDIDVLMIMLRHFGPILKNFLQTSSRYQEMQALARVFESLQNGANKVVPMEVVEQIVAADPNHYPVTDVQNIDGKPLAGKFFQVHRGTMHGEPVLVRVMLPDVENTLEFERLILLKLAEPLSKIYIRGHTDRASAIQRMRRLVEAKYLNHKIELNIPVTVANQNEARSRLRREPRVFKTANGPITLSVDVPEAFPAVEGSRVMITRLVEDVVPVKQVIEDHPEVALTAADYLTELFYEELAFRPLSEYRGAARRSHQRTVASGEDEGTEAAVPDAQAIEALGDGFAVQNRPDALSGMAHGDLHGGNVLFQATNDPATTGYTLHLIDWGLTSWIRADQVENIAIAAYGGEFNHSQIIAKNLMQLSSGSSYSDREIRAIIDKKAKELESKRHYWGPDDWISYMWIHGYMEFPNYLVALADARHALFDLRAQMGHTQASSKRFMDQLYAKHAWSVVKRSIASHPWHGLLSTKVIRRGAKYQTIKCLEYIIGETKPVDPWRG
ncbi:MAG: hypothetical protein KDD51_06765 [Bdellovibrionales bacterium]|nr:hypothetical protein [Bdellovibrionales bacterium]